MTPLMISRSVPSCAQVVKTTRQHPLRAKREETADTHSSCIMSEHLTPLDATFLELEEFDDSAHMHIGGIMVFDPLPDGGPPSREELCEHLASRLGELPRYRQRLSEPHTGGLSWPEWEDDSAFDIARHVARAALPPPGGYEELAEWASGFFSQRLDRHRPLWEMALVEGLADRSLGARAQDTPLDGRWRRLNRCRPPAARHHAGRRRSRCGVLVRRERCERQPRALSSSRSPGVCISPERRWPTGFSGTRVGGAVPPRNDGPRGRNGNPWRATPA